MFGKRSRLLFVTGIICVLGTGAFLSTKLNSLQSLGKQIKDKTHEIQASLKVSRPPFFGQDHKATHVEIISKITSNGEWFQIVFGNRPAYNPNIIPHPEKNDTWIIVAQRDKSQDDDIVWFTQLVCEAVFKGDKLICVEQPLILPIASTVSPHCDGDLQGIFNLTMGPHDARVFQGPDQPFIIYGSQSQYGCFGLWIHDFRRLVDWTESPDTSGRFFWPTDIPRAKGIAHHRLEKNWFPFWDSKGEMYFHYDIAPARSFAKINFAAKSQKDLVTEDLALFSQQHDKKCMEKLMPAVHNPVLESIHQATNSLAVTMCKRSDPKCVKSEKNTFIFTIFQFKSFYNHGVFEPYAMVFKQTASFEVYGISSKPFWYHGRGEAGGPWVGDSKWIPNNSTQMVYTVSMNWKQQGLTYNGYLDDCLFISFGVEDKRSFGIDVTAGDLLAGITRCD